MSRRRIYLDHAATSWPKSAAVLEAMDHFARHCGAAAGRGGYQSAGEADQIVTMARRSIANMIGAAASDCISLHANGTAALNAAIHGVVRPGDHVVTCAAEHNSVLRPLHHLQQHHNVRLSIIGTDDNGTVDVGEMIDAVTPDTRLVTLTHASNVTGAVQPIKAVGDALKDLTTLFLCDAAQTFGTIAIDVADAGIDLLAAPGHKCSGGPLGTGFLYVAERIHDQLIPATQGGTGSQSESLDMPTEMPSILEPGNLNVPAIAGWSKSLSEIQAGDTVARLEHARRMANHLHEGIASIDQLNVYGRANDLPIASVGFEGLSPTDAAVVLDAEFGIETRAGLHCAALIHQYLGSDAEGTLRVSAGSTSTVDEIDSFLEAVREILASLHPH